MFQIVLLKEIVKIAGSVFTVREKKYSNMIPIPAIRSDELGPCKGFMWRFTGRSSPNDVMPLNPQYESHQERLLSFKIWKNCTYEQADRLADLGYFFGLHFSDEGWLICFACGCNGNYKDISSSKKEHKVSSYIFLHHWHCPYIKSEMDEGNKFVQNSHIPQEEIIESNSDEVKKLVQEIRMKVALKRKRPVVTLDEYKKYSSQWKCQICCVSPLEVGFSPCQHSECCFKCSKGLSTCNVCDEPITGIIRYYPDNFEHNVRTAFRPEDLETPCVPCNTT